MSWGVLSFRRLQDRVRRADQPRKEGLRGFVEKGESLAEILDACRAAEQAIYQDLGDRCLKGKIFACVYFFKMINIQISVGDPNW